MNEYSVTLKLTYNTHAPNEDIAEERAQKWADVMQDALSRHPGFRFDIEDLEVDVDEL